MLQKLRCRKSGTPPPPVLSPWSSTCSGELDHESPEGRDCCLFYLKAPVSSPELGGEQVLGAIP